MALPRGELEEVGRGSQWRSRPRPRRKGSNEMSPGVLLAGPGTWSWRKGLHKRHHEDGPTSERALHLSLSRGSRVFIRSEQGSSCGELVILSQICPASGPHEPKRGVSTDLTTWPRGIALLPPPPPCTSLHPKTA